MAKYIEDKIEFFKMHKGAQTPRKLNPSFSLWDIFLTGRQDSAKEDHFGEVTPFTTGLQLTIPQGYLGFLVLKPTIINSGYSMAMGIQIVRPGSTSELVIYLRKDKNLDDLDLPIAAVELFLQPEVKVHLSQSAIKKEETYQDVDYDVYTPIIKDPPKPVIPRKKGTADQKKGPKSPMF